VFLKELESILDRAVSQLSGQDTVQVPEEVFWFATQVQAPGFTYHAHRGNRSSSMLSGCCSCQDGLGRQLFDCA
jgi:hypothetical protein